jgi:hypothetical protein
MRRAASDTPSSVHGRGGGRAQEWEQRTTTKITVPDLNLVVLLCQDPLGIDTPLDGRGQWELVLVEWKDIAEGTHGGVCGLTGKGGARWIWGCRSTTGLLCVESAARTI